MSSNLVSSLKKPMSASPSSRGDEPSFATNRAWEIDRTALLDRSERRHAPRRARRDEGEQHLLAPARRRATADARARRREIEHALDVDGGLRHQLAADLDGAAYRLTRRRDDFDVLEHGGDLERDRHRPRRVAATKWSGVIEAS